MDCSTDYEQQVKEGSGNQEEDLFRGDELSRGRFWFKEKSRTVKNRKGGRRHALRRGVMIHV